MGFFIPGRFYGLGRLLSSTINFSLTSLHPLLKSWKIHRIYPQSTKLVLKYILSDIFIVDDIVDASEKNALIYICQWKKTSNFILWGGSLLLCFLASVPGK